MSLLFDREARITVGIATGAPGSKGTKAGLRVEKHRCAFKVEKTRKQEPNTCTLQVYDLSKDQRGRIEELRPKKGDKRGIPVLIEAGYKTQGGSSNLSQIFLGDLRTVYSTKERDGGWCTTLEAGDGEKAISTARISLSFGPKTGADTVLRAIVKTLGVGAGNVNSAIAKLRSKGLTTLYQHGVTLSGSASIQLTNFCKSADLDWSIQDGAIQLVDRGKALSTKAIKLSSKTGLVETPSVDQKGVMTCKMLMIQDVRPGRLLVLDSLTVKGNYVVEKASWEGDTWGGPWYVTCECKRY